MTEKKYSGGCACGAIRFEATGEPVAEQHCQCEQCRKRSGTGHSSYAVFAGADAVTVTGETQTWRVAGDSGNDKIQAFCPTCGTPIHVKFDAMPGVTAIHVGSLDDPAWFHPTHVTYGSRGHDWDRQDPDLTVFEKMPPA